LEDIFALQDEIASQIVSTVNVEIDDTEQERANRKQPESLDAWELHQRGMWHMWRLGKQDRDEARRFFETAVDLAPTFASPQAGMAYLGCLDVLYDTTTSVQRSLAEALQAGKRAVELDDRDAFARFALGRAHTFLGNVEAAIAEGEKAVQLSPSFALAHHGLGYSRIWFGKAEEALPALETAARLSPNDPMLWAFYLVRGWCYFHLDDFASAETHARKALQESPNDNIWSHVLLVSTLAAQDRITEAKEVVHNLTAIRSDISLRTARNMQPHMAKEFADKINEALRKAGLPE